MDRKPSTAELAPHAHELTLCFLCVLAYLDPIDVQANELIAEFDTFQAFQESDSEAFAVIKDDTAVVVFRGTETNKPSDIIGNVRWTWPTEKARGKVHSGFEAYTNRLRPALAEFKDKHKPLQWICCGHSLGGAAATIFASDLRESGEKSVHLFTIGSPRVGTLGFAAMLGQRLESVTRFVSGSDLVPRVPPPFKSATPFTPDYRHVGPKLLLSEKGDIHESPDAALSAWTCVMAIVKHLWAPLIDHKGKEYLQRIQKWCDFRYENDLPLRVNIPWKFGE